MISRSSLVLVGVCIYLLMMNGPSENVVSTQIVAGPGGPIDFWGSSLRQPALFLRQITDSGAVPWPRYAHKIAWYKQEWHRDVFGLKWPDHSGNKLAASIVSFVHTTKWWVLPFIPEEEEAGHVNEDALFYDIAASLSPVYSVLCSKLLLTVLYGIREFSWPEK